MFVCFLCLAFCFALYLLCCFLFLYPRSLKGEGSILFYPCPSFRPSKIFLVAFFSVTWWQKSDIWSQASYRYTILWVAFLDPSDSYFLFADLVGFYTHWTYRYLHIFRHIFLSNYWWQKSDIWSQASYRYMYNMYPISWEAFFDPSDSYFLFAEERGYHRWALAHSSSCCLLFSFSIAKSFFFFFDFHVLFVSFLLQLLIFVCICFHFASTMYIFLFWLPYWPLFVFSSSVSISHSLLLWKRLMVHYHIQCGLCSVCRLYMNLFNFIVYYHNSKIFFIKIYGNNVY